MILVPYTFNSVSLQSTDFETSIPRQSALSQVETNIAYTRRAGAFPLYSGKDIQPFTLNLEVKLLHDYMTLIETLNSTFNVYEETPKVFVCQDSEDSNKQYYVYATPKRVLAGHDGQMATVQISFDDPVWQTVTQNSQPWTVTATGQSTDFVNSGNIEAYPILEIAPSAYSSTGYIFNNFIEYLPQSAYSWTNRPLEILSDTAGIGMDTAALVTAGKALSSGNDFLVYVDGVEVDRWFGGAGFNTTDTKCWINIDQPPAVTLTLKTAIASTDSPTTVEFVYSAADRAEFQYTMKETGRFKIDSEEFVYTSRTITNTSLIANGITRAQRATSAGSHSANATVTWIPYDIKLVYGNASAAAPDIDETKKPIMNLTTSWNASFAYTVFQDRAKQRSGIFSAIGWGARQPDPYLGARGAIYKGLNNGGDTDPVDVLGVYVKSYQLNGVWQPGQVQGVNGVQWQIYIPDGISTVTYSYERYQYNTSTPTIGTYSSTNSAEWLLGRSFTTLATTDFQTWVTGTDATSDVSIITNATYLMFIMSGSISATANNYVAFGVTSATIGITNPPVITRRGETSQSTSQLIISNGATGESITINSTLQVGDTLVVDTDPNFPYAKLNGQFLNSIVSLSSVRPAWLPFATGTNTLTVTVDFINSITITVKWRDRMNFL